MTEITQQSADYLTPVRQAVLAAALPHVPFDGWTAHTLNLAINDAGIDSGLAVLAFPDGWMDLVYAFWNRMDAELAQEIARRAPHNSHVSQRISEALRIYIRVLRPHREAVRRALALQALPMHAPGALMCLYHTVDTMWRGIGDQSTDFNFYTKRATLAAIVASVVTHWLGESDNDPDAMDAFIARRMDNVLAFEKMKARVRGLTHYLPSPDPLLGRIAGRFTGARRNF